MKRTLLIVLSLLSICTLAKAQSTGYVPFEPSGFTIPGPVPPDSLYASNKAGFFGQGYLCGTVTNACATYLCVSSTNGRVIRVITSNPFGQFYCFLKPGEYVVRATPLSRMRPAPLRLDPFYITVSTNEVTRMDVYFQLPAERPVSAAVGQDFDIDLANADSAAQWVLQPYNTNLLRCVYGLRGPNSPNVPQSTRFHFQALAPGQAKLRFRYGVYDQPPLLTTNFLVTITE